MDSRSQRIIIQEYPSLLAATYAKKMAPYPAVSLEQAFQFHMGLRDVSEAIIKYLAVTVLAQYRKDTRMPGHSNDQVERGLRELQRPSIGDWISLLYSTLNLYKNSDEELLQQIYSYYFTQRHRDNAPVAIAVEQIQDWLELRPRRSPPFSYRDFFELLGPYRNDPRGWAAHGAILSNREYLDRSNVLRPALERALVDLKFLADYTPIHVQSVNKSRDGNFQHRLNLSIGRNPDMAEIMTIPWALEPEHIYVCRQTPQGREPFLDLYPLLIEHDCTGCRDQTVFVVNFGEKGRLEYLSYSCGHDLPLNEEQYKIDFSRFLKLEEWQRSAGPDIRSNQPGELAYRNVLREMLKTGGIIDETRRAMMTAIASSMNLTSDKAVWIEQEVYREQMQAEMSVPEGVQAAELDDDTKDSPTLINAVETDITQPTTSIPENVEPLVTPTQTATEDVVQLDEYVNEDTAPSVLPELSESVLPTDLEITVHETIQVVPVPTFTTNHKLILCWSQPMAAPVYHIALVGSPPWIFAITVTGAVVVFDTDQNIVYRDQIDGRVYRTAALEDRLIVGTWEGVLYCFGRQGLLWQSHVRSPISALCVSKGRLEIVVGTWGGQIYAYHANGEHLWESQLDDGISSLSMHQSGVKVVVGTYAGHLALLDADGSKLWLWTMPAAVVSALFDSTGQDIFVLTQDRNVLRLNAQKQERIWEEALEESPILAALSGNTRRLVTLSTSSKLSAYMVNGGLKPVKLPEGIGAMTSVFISPVSKDGNFIVGYSPNGLVFADELRADVTMESELAATCVALSTDGLYTAQASADQMRLYRLTRPELHLTIAPQEKLRKDRFARINLSLENKGERLARDIEIKLSGPIKYTPIRLPQPVVAPGVSITFTDQPSLQPEAEGSLPVYIRLSYVDDLGITYTKDEIQMLEVTYSS